MKKETIKTMDARRLCGRWMAAIAFSLLYFTGMEAQNMSDSIAVDSIRREMGIGQKTIDKGTKAVAELPLMLNDTTVAGKKRKVKRDWTTWSPDPQKALWMALVIPGGGQIYNRKYWKLPLVYGGFMGCLYAMSWNNMMYKDYSQAYLDIMDSDPNTKSYEKILAGEGFRISEARNCIEIVSEIRNAVPIGLKGDYHPLAKLPLAPHPFGW